MWTLAENGYFFGIVIGSSDYVLFYWEYYMFEFVGFTGSGNSTYFVYYHICYYHCRSDALVQSLYFYTIICPKEGIAQPEHFTIFTDRDTYSIGFATGLDREEKQSFY